MIKKKTKSESIFYFFKRLVSLEDPLEPIPNDNFFTKLLRIVFFLKFLCAKTDRLKKTKKIIVKMF